MSILDKEGKLKSDLWLDQPDAHGAVDNKLKQGELNKEQAEKFHDFVDRGYLRFRLSLQAEVFEALNRDVDRLWGQRPADLAFAFLGEPTSMADSRKRTHRMAPYRILDLHSHSDAALRLYLSSEIFSWTDRLFGQPSVAFQTSFSEFGRRESPYRDPAYIETLPPNHLLSAWIATEDIDLASGPLYLVPGSHRLPFYEFSPDRITIQPDEEYLEAHRFMMAKVEEAGLSEELLTCKRGDVFIWHAGILHGAKRVLRPHTSRRGFLIRYSTKATMKSRTASYFKTVRGRFWKRERRLYWNKTERLIEREGCCGFDNPLRGLRPKGLSIGEKIKTSLGRRRGD